MQKALELVVHKRMSQGEGVKGKKRWSAEEIKKKPSSSMEDDAKEMRKWRDWCQEEMGQCWKNLAGRMEEEVLDMYKIEDSKRVAFRCRGAPLEWRRVRRSKKYRPRRW